MQWYKGDLHIHTQYSDGTDTLEEVIEAMLKQGMDFLAITDHRTVEPIKNYPKDMSLLLIPAFEFGSEIGHANIFGISELLKSNVSISQQETKQSLVEAREKGAYISINHPYDLQYPWEVDFEEIAYDWIEVWNGSWSKCNQQTLKWWHEQLCMGKKIPIVGGSDYHGSIINHHLCQPTTWVCADNLSTASILESLNLGNSLITASPTAPFVNLKCGSCIVGNTATGFELVSLKVDGIQSQDIVKLVTDKGIIYEEKNIRNRCIDEKISINEIKFVRAEVYRYDEMTANSNLISLTNPIYFE